MLTISSASCAKNLPRETRSSKKVTYKADEDPKSVLASFRNDYYPRIAVTVDMIATGTDVKPLECLVFMRDVRSRNYFEQMKGRGTRTLGYDDLKKVTPSVYTNKTGFVIVDAVGVSRSVKTDSRSLERKKSVPLKDLLQAVLMGQTDEDTYTSLAGRLARLEKQITEDERGNLSNYPAERLLIYWFMTYWTRIIRTKLLKLWWKSSTCRLVGRRTRVKNMMPNKN